MNRKEIKAELLKKANIVIKKSSRLGGKAELDGYADLEGKIGGCKKGTKKLAAIAEIDITNTDGMIEFDYALQRAF